MICRIFLFRIFLFFLICFQSESTLTKTCSGHDGCKGDEWVGSYEITCNGGERICHNTVLKCGRDNCKIIVKGSGHDAYQNSIVYAQNIKKGGGFILNCKASGQRKCKNNVIYCPREIGTECVCKNCHSTTIMYYKYGTYLSTVVNVKRYWDEPVVCDGRLECERDEMTKTLDYSTTSSYHYLYKGYPSFTTTYTYNLYKDKYGNNLHFSMFIGEWYKSWSYVSLPGQNPAYTYKLINYSDTYGMMGKVCRRRIWPNGVNYYYYKGKCHEYKYGDPYEGFWVLGEPAQSCTMLV